MTDVWSAVAGEWSALWGSFTAPVAERVVAAVVSSAVSAVSSDEGGARMLDLGCGSGELLRAALDAGLAAAGIDAAPGMVALARRRAPGAEVVVGSIDELPWPDGSFDAVVAVNALPFADEPAAALREAARVLRPGGRMFVAGWSDDVPDDIALVEDAVTLADGEEPERDERFRTEAGVTALLTASGFEVVSVELVAVTWVATDEETLVRGVLLGEDAAGLAEFGPVVVAAAAPCWTADGGYALRARLRLVTATRRPLPLVE